MKLIRVPGILAALLLAGCSLLRSPPADAGTAIVTWTNPVLNTDGSAIQSTQGQPEALQTWRVEYGTCNGAAFGVKAGEFVRARAAAGAEITSATNNVPPGNTCFRVYVANFAGGESPASNVAARVIAPAIPNAPTNAAANNPGS